MKCEYYQNLISEFLDNELDEPVAADVKSHLAICPECARTFEECASIVQFSGKAFQEDSTPLNSQAMWCRITNLIETEIEPDSIANNPEPAKPGLIKRFFNGSVQFSPPQIVTSVLGIALMSSLLTIVSIKNFTGPNEIHIDEEQPPNVVETMLSSIGVVETPQQKHQRRIEEQRSAIAYWIKRVELRRVQWDSHLQIAFDRNLREIDKAVNEYTKILQENPEDKISTEMLDSALSEKMEFLREFAEL